MIERDSPISVTRQAQLLDLSRSSVYYVARSLPGERSEVDADTGRVASEMAVLRGS
jgi:hypothetical protein